MKWSDFFVTKKEMVEPTCEKLHQWKQAGVGVKKIRCDNAGENVSLENRCKSAAWKLDVEFEYTARDTPQQNSMVEVGFATLGNRGRAMMIAANVPEKMVYKLFREAFTCATMIDWLSVVEIKGRVATRIEHWGGELPKFTAALRTWGEAGVVKVKTKTSPKMVNRGTTCMFVGYAVNHSDGVYRIWNSDTNRILISRDVVWLKRMFYQKDDVLPELSVTVDEVADNGAVSDNEAGESVKTVTFVDENKVDDAEEESDDDIEGEALEDKNSGWENFYQTRSGRVVKPVRRSGDARYEDIAAMALTQAEFGYQANLRDIAMLEFASQDYALDFEIAAVGAGLGGGFQNTRELKPMKYDEGSMIRP